MVLIRGYFSPQIELKSSISTDQIMVPARPWSFMYCTLVRTEVLSSNPIHWSPIANDGAETSGSYHNFPLGSKSQSMKEFLPLWCKDRLFLGPMQKHCIRCLHVPNTSNRSYASRCR